MACFVFRWPFDEAWGYDRGETVGETGTVCDWSGVRDGTLDMPTCIKDICGGHNPEDVLPFKIKVKTRGTIWAPGVIGVIATVRSNDFGLYARLTERSSRKYIYTYYKK